MEALTISAANLNTIEKNLGAVADELSGVINNVTTVNNQVNRVESQVQSLNDEVKSLVKEIRETTIISNARQSIMYNNEQIDKKYSYYDSVRRTTESLLDAILTSSISKKTLYNLNQQLVLNNPDYWLANALSAISYWILDDRSNTEKEVNNALKKDKKKTSLFFALINLKIGRMEPAINWLKKYLSSQNPIELDKDFVTVIDLVAMGIFSDNAKDIVINKIQEWFNRMVNDKDIHNRAINTWKDYITEAEETQIYMPYLEMHAKNVGILKHNLITTSSYHNVYDKISDIMNEDTSDKDINLILHSLIYDYESKEQVYQLDNLRNNLIIACNGDTKEADRLFKKQESLYHENVDLVTLLSNIVMYGNDLKVSNETKKIALSLIKNYIIEAYIEKNNSVVKNNINIEVNGFMTDVTDVIDRDKLNRELDDYVEKEYGGEDKDIIIIGIILNILGIIGIFIILNNRILCSILIAIVIIGDILIMAKMSKRNRMRMNAKMKTKNSINNVLDKILAETVDYFNLLKGDEVEYNKLINYLNSINTLDYIKSNGERNIRIGE